MTDYQSAPSGLFIGLSTIDVYYMVERLPAPDEKVAAILQSSSAGGPATNAAVAFAWLGGRSRLVSGVGSHDLASIVRAELLHFGIAHDEGVIAFRAYVHYQATLVDANGTPLGQSRGTAIAREGIRANRSALFTRSVESAIESMYERIAHDLFPIPPEYLLGPPAATAPPVVAEPVGEQL